MMTGSMHARPSSGSSTSSASSSSSGSPLPFLHNKAQQQYTTLSDARRRSCYTVQDTSYHRGVLHATFAWLLLWVVASHLWTQGYNEGAVMTSTVREASTHTQPCVTPQVLQDAVMPHASSPSSSSSTTSTNNTTKILATETWPDPPTTIQVVEQVSQGSSSTTSSSSSTSSSYTFTDRALYQNGHLVTSLRHHVPFYESLVHPAFMASSTPVQRVLLVGGATGGALREVLKYTNVTSVTVVVSPVDEMVQRLTQHYLPAVVSSSTGSTTSSSIWNDKRVHIVRTENVWMWLRERFGNMPDGNCNAQYKQTLTDKLYDLILFDKLDRQAMAAMTDTWSSSQHSTDTDSSYSDSQDTDDDDDEDDQDDEEDNVDHKHVWYFAKRVSCALSPFGVVSMSMGQAPPPGFALAMQQTAMTTVTTSSKNKPLHKHPLVQAYARRMELMNQMTDYFWHKRVYDIPLSGGQYWTVAVAMVPWTGHLSENVPLQRAVFDGRATGGANDFDDRPAKINIQLRRTLKPGTRLQYYDGVVQQFFQYPAADWHGVYCLHPDHYDVCHITDAFSTDYEDDIMHLQLAPDHNGHSGAFAKTAIPKGTITGLWDAATDINMPAIQFYRSRHLAEGFETQYNDFAAWVDTYGFDGGPSGLGERVQVSINSYHNFLNHDCDHKPNMINFGQWAPWARDAMKGWNPIKVRIAGEIDHFKAAARDIAPGELILDDYSKWDGFLQSRNGQQDFSRLDAWCNGTVVHKL